jgi:YVTN family beta-propeller protein
VTASVPTAAHPYAIAVNSVTNKIYVLNRTTSGSVTVIDGKTHATSSIPVGANPSSLDINMVTNRVYVANSDDGTVSVIDGAANAVVATVATGVNPLQVVVNSKNGHVYVMNATADGTETVIDGATNAVVDQIFGGTDPRFITVDPNLDTLYVIAFVNNDWLYFVTPTVYSAVGLVSQSTITNGNDTIGLVVGDKQPQALAVDTANDQLFISNVNQGGVDIVNFTNLTRSSYHTVGIGDFGKIVVNPATGIGYALSDDGGTDSVHAIDGKTNADTAILAGSNAEDVAVNPTTNLIYVANNNSAGTVTVIDGATNGTTTLAVGANPFLVAVNPVTNTVYAVNDDGNGTVSVIDGASASAAPAITAQPQDQTVNLGATVVFNAAASGRPATTYQWTFNGAALVDGAGISGSGGATLVVTGTTAANAGHYALVATNSAGQATSTAASLSVISTPTPGHLVNLSTRARIESGIGVNGSQVLIAGFVVAGSGSKSLVLRGIGPTLGAFGVAGAIDLPSLALYDAAVPANRITQDTGWQSAPTAPAGLWAGQVVPVDATASDFSAVGAFALPQGSADSAVKLSLPAGAYTSQITATDSTNGIVLAEVYDASSGTGGSQLINISSRAFVGEGVNAMIAGFVISGSSSETVLIRASGPALGPLGVTSLLTNPNVLLYDSKANLIDSNSGWGGDTQIAAAATRVGAFAWTDPASTDSALLVTLPPGAYTAEINPAVQSNGNALIEVYAVP